ncbi:excitatory amino acid transporter 3-like [Oppia nitens]|uniref:excitatory amino acid transporter 3-like n=1 Tax=Oppia nitens TaxID=1686743 RepID=UPI0023DA9CFC|nr:excitatory amino acid transporter 3-like [Oppia nitens]
MILSCLSIDFNDSSVSLICHLITSFFGLSVSYGLLSNKYETKQSIYSKILRIISENILAISTLISVIIAVVIGILLRDNNPDWNNRSIKYIGFIGELFLRVLKGLVLPLIFTSLVYAMSDIDTKLFGKIGIRCVAYYITSTILAIILGIILVVTIKPGSRVDMDLNDKPNDKSNKVKLTTMDTILDLIRNLFPDNIVEACFRSFSTNLTPPNGTDGSDIAIEEWDVGSKKTDNMNILGVVVFAVVLGVIIGHMKEEGKVLADFFKSFNNAMMTLTVVVIKITPLAVIFLVLPQILNVKDLSQLLGSVGWYTLTVMVGLAIHSIFVLPATYLILVRKNPYKIITQMLAALMTAFGTGSSTATMPVTFQCLEENLKYDKRVVRFCIPVGATINMDGTALYEAVAAIFIAQYRGLELDFVQIIVIAVTATAASIGAAGIPQAGLVTMVIVLNAVGLPETDAALIYVIDWLIDRFRTVINVLGDAYGASIVYHLSQKDIDDFDAIDASN